MQGRREIRERVLELLRRKGLAPEISDETPLVSSGLLDSMDIVQLVLLLEKRWDVDFSERGFNPGQFDTVKSMCSLIAAAESAG